MNKDDEQQAATDNDKICHKKITKTPVFNPKSISYSLQLSCHKN